MTRSTLQAEYDTLLPIANQLKTAVTEQLEALIRENNVTLGTPIEGRVKSWESLEEKIHRRSLDLATVSALHDLVGLRLVLLFYRDVETVCRLIAETFVVVSAEDVSERLTETQFGYRSRHFVVRLPEAWLSMPTLKGVGELQVEIQVRTVAQHIWAAASHKLQYKHEQSVPFPLRRAIHRVAALLETVDLEFERVLQGRDSYNSERAEQAANEPLNVDTLRAILTEVLPSANRKEPEPYDELLQDLMYVNVVTPEQLRGLIKKHYSAVLDSDRKRVAEAPRDGYPGTTRERNEMGVFWTHAGWLRSALTMEFGDRARTRFAQNFAKRKQTKRKGE